MGMGDGGCVGGIDRYLFDILVRIGIFGDKNKTNKNLINVVTNMYVHLMPINNINIQ